MDTHATITVNRRAIEAVIEQLIEMIDTADRITAMDAEKAAQDAEG